MSEKSADSSLLGRSFGSPAWMPFAIIALLWMPAFIRFSYMWSLNPQYYYGWAVPLLSAYLIFDRWFGLPAPETPRHRSLAVTGMVLLALPQLPLRLVGEANSSARLISLAMGAAAMGISFGILYLSGGRVWMRYFMGPLLFLAVSIPWPTQVEKPLVQGLMRVNAEISAEVVSFAGVPAEAHGNVIEIPTGVLGVNEACSGIRSLQSTVMAACFLAVLYRCSAGGFFLLLAAGTGIAFVCNIVRTVFLTWQGAFHGIEATEKWHDSAGFAILGVVLVCLWLMSQFMEWRQRRKESASDGSSSGEEPASR